VQLSACFLKGWTGSWDLAGQTVVTAPSYQHSSTEAVVWTELAGTVLLQQPLLQTTSAAVALGFV
jgi:hypothetical protein